MRYFWSKCLECGDEWVAPCFVEFGMIVPESESCSDCGGDIEIEEDGEWIPSEHRGEDSE